MEIRPHLSKKDLGAAAVAGILSLGITQPALADNPTPIVINGVPFTPSGEPYGQCGGSIGDKTYPSNFFLTVTPLKSVDASLKATGYSAQIHGLTVGQCGVTELPTQVYNQCGGSVWDADSKKEIDFDPSHLVEVTKTSNGLTDAYNLQDKGPQPPCTNP